MDSKRLGPLPRIRRAALGRGCGRKGREGAAVISTGAGRTGRRRGRREAPWARARRTGPQRPNPPPPSRPSPLRRAHSAAPIFGRLSAWTRAWRGIGSSGEC